MPPDLAAATLPARGKPAPSSSIATRLALLAMACGGFAIGTGEFASMSLLPQLSAGLGIDEPTAGHLISAYALGVVVGAPAIAILAAKLPKRTLLIGLMAFFAAANIASALAPGFGWILAARFLSGLPHGAYFGVAALVAASLVPHDHRTEAVGRMMLGLTAATIAGVPLANIVGQWAGWRWGFVIVAALATLTAALILRFVRHVPAQPGASPLRELGALARPQVWLTLATGAIGFGGMFAVYTYLASTLTEVTGAAPTMIPVALALFGIGMTAGTLVCAWAADRALMPAAGITLAAGIAILLLYPLATLHLATILPVVFLVGCGGGLSTILQARLMDVAGDGQTLAASLNHSAFNIANALGPWLGGMAITAGLGWSFTGYVGAALAAAGLAIWALSFTLDRYRR